MVEGSQAGLLFSSALPLTSSLGSAFTVSWAVPALDGQLPLKLDVLLWPSRHGHVALKYSGPKCLPDLQVGDPGVIKAV